MRLPKSGPSLLPTPPPRTGSEPFTIEMQPDDMAVFTADYHASDEDIEALRRQFDVAQTLKHPMVLLGSGLRFAGVIRRTNVVEPRTKSLGGDS